MEDSAISELQKLLNASTEENQQRIFYVLDYVSKYFTGERRIPKISYYGFSSELQQLKQIGIIEETRLYWRGNEYPRLLLKDQAKTEIKSILKERYYPLFDSDSTTSKMQEIITKSFPAATKLWHMVQKFEIGEYSLSGPSSYDRELVEFGEKMANNGLAYLIGYWSTSWATYYEEIIFRKEPIDTRIIFIKLVQDEMISALSSFSPEMKWCLYLKHVYPQADEKFFLKNTTTTFLPLQIKNALARLPSLEIEKFKELTESICAEQRERLSETMRNLINNDPTSAAVLGTLFSLGKEEERHYKIDSWAMSKAKEALKDYEMFRQYVSHFKNLGVIFESPYDEIIVPKTTWEVFCDEIKGKAVDIRIFDSELDGQSFLEEKIGKAASDIKVWDPYVSTKTLAILERSVKSEKVQIEILSSQPTIIEEIIHLARKGMKIRARIVHLKEERKPLSPWHDRYLIIDDVDVWHMGPSLHAIGQKMWESAELFAKSLGETIVDAFRYNFFSKAKEEWEREGYQVDEIGV
jgi:hypothetical protein